MTAANQVESPNIPMNDATNQVDTPSIAIYEHNKPGRYFYHTDSSLQQTMSILLGYRYMTATNQVNTPSIPIHDHNKPGRYS